MDFGDAKWDLTITSRTTSKDKSSDTESLPLSTNIIVAPLDIYMVLPLPYNMDSLSATILMP